MNCFDKNRSKNMVCNSVLYEEHCFAAAVSQESPRNLSVILNCYHVDTLKTKSGKSFLCLRVLHSQFVETSPLLSSYINEENETYFIFTIIVKFRSSENELMKISTLSLELNSISFRFYLSIVRLSVCIRLEVAGWMLNV